MFRKSIKPAFGVDISDLSVKLVQLKEKRKGLDVKTFLKQDIPSEIVEEGVVKDPKKLGGLIKETVERTKGLEGERVVASLPEEKIFIRVIQLPKMDQDEIDKAVKWEAEAYIPIKIDEAYLSWQIIEPIGEKVDHLDILIAATPKFLVDDYVKAFYEAGLQPVALEPESVAVVRSLIKPDDLNSCIIVDLGATATNFVIYSAGAIRFTSQVPISGNQLNQSVKEKLGVSEKEAERLKVKAGLKPKEDQVYKIDFEGMEKVDKKNKPSVREALMPIAENLAQQIIDYISFYRNHSSHIHGPNGSIDKIILCGGDSLLKGLPEFLREKLERPVKNGEPLVNVSGGVDKIDKPALYATALGLSLRDFMS